MKAAAAILLLACAAPALSSRSLLAPAPAAITDNDILNFALNLEYLEAQFYSWAAFGKGLDASLLGANPGPVTGGRKADLSGAVAGLALQLAEDEIAHVKFLRDVLGSAAIDQPALNISSAFSTAANTALGETLNPVFDPYFNNLFFLHGSFLFEDLGVTAYKGAIPSIASKQVLEGAAGILPVEAYHGGSIRSAICPVSNIPTTYGVTPATITQKIADLFNKLGGVDASSGVLTRVNGQDICNLAPTDDKALAFARTPEEVIAIATGGSTGKGLFFPNGLNGAIGETAKTG